MFVWNDTSTLELPTYLFYLSIFNQSFNFPISLFIINALFIYLVDYLA